MAFLTTRLHELLDGNSDMHLLMTIPGVGFITAATLTAEVGDWSRFSSARQLSAYFGIIPSVRASGTVAHYGHITRAWQPSRQASARRGGAHRQEAAGAGPQPLPLSGQASRQEGRPRRRGPPATGTVLDPPAQRGGVSGGVRGEPVARAGSVNPTPVNKIRPPRRRIAHLCALSKEREWKLGSRSRRWRRASVRGC